MKVSMAENGSVVLPNLEDMCASHSIQHINSWPTVSITPSIRHISIGLNQWPEVGGWGETE